MRRGTWIVLATGALGSIGWLMLAALGQPVMPSYLAGWLFCLSLPLGALPVLMLLELLGIRDWPIMVPLRRLLWLLPPAAMFAIPVLLRLGPLYARAGDVPGSFAMRMIIMLLIWTGLSLIFLRPPRRRPRRLLAALGLFLHLAIVSFAAVDWIMQLDPGLGASGFGLLAVSLQVSVALTAALFALAIGGVNGPPAAEAVPLLLAALGGWMFLHFIQYLIVWSADLPAEIVWYQHRTEGLGGAALWFGFVAALLAFAAALPHRLARMSWLLASVSTMLLLVHLIEMLWLVTPGFRGRFTLSLADLAAVIGLAGLSAGFLLLIEGKAARHDPA